MKRKKELPDIVDKEVKKVKSILTQEDVNELFEYRDGDLYWKIDIYTGKISNIHKIKIGDKAGGVFKTNNYNFYKLVSYNKNVYIIARLIFLMFNGYLPQCITYKDGDTLNTRIENLLEANKFEIYYRRKLSSKNKTGYKGVHYHKQSNKYVAQIYKHLKHIYLGLYDTAEEASKVCEIAKEKYHEDFLKRCEND